MQPSQPVPPTPRLSRGALVLGRRRPVHLHWSVVLGLLVAGQLETRPHAWTAYLALVMVHQLGHALAVRGLGLRIEAVRVHALGGHCDWRGPGQATVTQRQRAIIAWGGILAQGVVLAGTALALSLADAPPHGAAADVVQILTEANLYMIVVNLLPLPPFDGAEAWRVFTVVREVSLDGDLERELRELEALDRRAPPRALALEVDAQIREVIARAEAIPKAGPQGEPRR